MGTAKREKAVLLLLADMKSQEPLMVTGTLAPHCRRLPQDNRNGNAVRTLLNPSDEAALEPDR